MSRFFWFLVYSFLFLCVGGSVIAYNLGYSPFTLVAWRTGEIFINPFSDWHKLYKMFEFGSWAVDSTKNLVIFFTFLFYFPLWLSIWFFLSQIRWKRTYLRFLCRFRHHEVVTPKKEPIIVKNTMGRPMAMRRMRGFGGSMVMPQNTSAQQNAPVGTTTSTDSTKSSETAPRTVNAIQKEQLRVLGEKYGFDLFESVRLDEHEVPFVFATDTLALVTYVLLDSREWIVDETPSEEGLEPTWFSAEGLITSPFYKMVEASNLLREKEPDSQIVPVVVIANGTILNASAIQEQWEEKGGFVVLWNKGKGEGLPTLEELLQVKAQEDAAGASTSVEEEDSEADVLDEEEIAPKKRKTTARKKTSSRKTKKVNKK